ncbi:MAG: hypothetical protein N3G48_07350 [Sulfolobales archaeon]|nr:hypothetical protein [Sulfolobales archaeon]MCX8186902.1 hypothetical protein [Sulfolobales archaeon]
MRSKLIPLSKFKIVVVINLVTSIAISTTGIYVLSVTASISRSISLGLDGDVLLYSSASKVPHTGLINVKAVNLTGDDEFLVLSPEVLTPVIVHGNPLFLRGLNLTLLDRLLNYSLVGRLPRSGDEVLVGVRLSNRLNISVGEVINVNAIPTGNEVAVLVTGLIISNTPLDDELVSNLQLSRRLRGVGDDYVTVIRLRVNNSHSITKRLEELPPLKRPSAPYVVVNKFLINRSLGDVELVDEAISRGINISSTLLWVSILLVLSISVLSIYFGMRWTLNTLEDVLKVLRSIGLSRFRLASMLIYRVMLVGMLSGATGYAISYLLLNEVFNALSVSILLHRVEPINDLTVLLTSTTLPPAVSSISIYFSVKDM